MLAQLDRDLSARLGELDRVGDQVLENLHDPLRVGEHHGGLAREPRFHLDALPAGQLGHPEEALLDQVVQRGGLELDRENARLDLRDVEDVLHEPDEPLHRFLAKRDQLPLVGRVFELGAGDQDVERALHHGQRRAHLM